MGGSISGTVYESDGITPVADADVWADIYVCCGGGNGTRSGANGSYTIMGLGSGEYRVQVESTGLAREYYQETARYRLATPVGVTSGQDTPNIDFTLEQAGAISGTVYEADGITPVANANVWANSYVCCGGGNGTQTDVNGDYTITRLAEGDYRVRAQAEDQGLAGEFYQDTSDWNLATSVTVTAGATQAGIDFTLVQGGSISGTVYQPDGVTPVTNGEVSANAYICCGGGNGARIGSDGTYTIAGLAPGDYRVQVHVGGQGLVGEFYDDTTDWNLATAVTVTAGVTQGGIDFTLAEGGSISGTVYEADGVTPVANADVWADSYVCCGGGNGTRTASDGTYTIQGLLPGDYRVQARAPGQGLAGEFYNDTTDWSLATAVTVATGATQGGIDFTLVQGGSISGTVYEADGVTPVANANVWANSYVCCGDGNGTRTGSDGTYTISALAPGEYRVQAAAEDQGLAGEFYNDTTDWSLATAVTVATGATQGGIDFTLVQGGSISGTVYEADGVTPVANADVWAETYTCCGGGNGTRSGTDGTYVIRGLLAGDYRIRASADHLGLASGFYDDTPAWDLATAVTVTAGATQSGIDFILAAGGTISGTVYESDGVTPVANLHVYAVDFDTGAWMAGANTDANGYYTLTLTTGTYQVRACAECGGPTTQPLTSSWGWVALFQGQCTRATG